MSASGKTIAKNASVLMASQLTTWVLTLLLTIFLPRYLGAVNSGKLAIATSLWALAAIFMTFGMDILLTKQIARDPSKASALASTSFLLRGVLCIAACGAVATYVQVANYPIETITVVAIGAFGAFVWQLIGASQAVLQGLEKMSWMSLANIVGKAFNTIVCIILLLLGQGIYVVATVAVLAALINFAIQFYALRREIKLHWVFDVRAMTEMLRAGLPYAMSGLFLVAYGQVDVIIISLLVDEKTVGWYGAANQLFGTSFFIPTVFITAVFPALSRMYATSSDTLPRLMRKSFDLLLIVSIPIGLGLFAIADPLIILLFGSEFAPSGALLALLGFVMIVTYQNMLIGQFLVSADRQNKWTIVMAVATLATIPLDLILVPWCRAAFQNGAIGGALSFMITEIGMLIFGLLILPPGSLDRTNAFLAVRALIAGIIMACGVWALREMFILIPIVIGAVIYLSFAFILRLFSPEDIALARQIISVARGRLGARVMQGR
jgi:O-antigen/teichoic acid export membrane protein